MNQTQRFLLYFVLTALAPLLFPPDVLAGMVAPSGGLSLAGIIFIVLYLVLFIGLGVLLMRGRSNALTLSIFLQGLNVIVRLMMLFPRVYTQGEFNTVFVITSFLSMALSMYLLLRLDKVDIRSTMVQ
jgi:hypothetical protein